MFQAGITPKQVSYRTVQRFLRKEGFQYLQTRKKGILTEKDLKERLKFAQKMQREYDDQFWKNIVYPFFWMESALSISIIQVIKHAHQRAVFGGLSYGCTAKGAHSGSGGTVAKFMVAVSYGNGVILCEQYEKLKGRYFKFSSRKRIPTNV